MVCQFSADSESKIREDLNVEEIFEQYYKDKLREDFNFYECVTSNSGAKGGSPIGFSGSGIWLF